MGAIVKIRSEEISMLRKEVEAKFLALRPDIGELKKNSFKGSYRELAASMQRQIHAHEVVVSHGLLRKLFYDSVDNSSGETVKELSFNSDFLDACYLYFSDNDQTRSQYQQIVPGIPAEAIQTANRKLKILVGVAIGFAVVLTLGVAIFAWMSNRPGPVTTGPAPEILLSKFVGEKADEGELEEGEVKIAWYLRTELDQYLETAMATDFVSSEAEAASAGEKAGVKFVIWGEVLGLSEEFITLFTKFQIIQMPDHNSERDSLLMANIDDFRRATYPIGEKGSCEFQQKYSEEWTCIALFAVGLTHYLEGEYAEAEEFFHNCLDNCNQVQTSGIEAANVEYYWGNASFHQQKYEVAQTHYQLALETQTDDPVLHTNLGAAFGEMALTTCNADFLDSAEVHFQEALALNPKYTLASTHLKQLHASRPAFSALTFSEFAKPPGETASSPSDSTPQVRITDLKDCAGEGPGDPHIPQVNAEELRTSLLDFMQESEKEIQTWCPDALQKKCLKKLTHSRGLLASGNFVKALPSAWSLYYEVNEKGGRETGTSENLECLKGISPSTLAGSQKRLETISLQLMQYYLAKGDVQKDQQQVNLAKASYQNAIIIASLFETSSSMTYGEAFENPNDADRKKSTALLRTGYLHLIEGNEGRFCDYVQWARFPANTPNTFNPSWLRDYNLRNFNNVRVENVALNQAEKCCNSFFGEFED